MSNFVSPRLTGALALGLAAFATTGAAAASDQVVVSSGHAVTRSVEVRTADLNLATAAGRDALASRITSATRRACGVGDGSALDGTGDARNCLARARQMAENQLRSLPGGATAVSAGMP